ncbi:uncharacterized protein LOC106172361 isoform X2 [Lingula anatina]|uniref:Uncharacterized protein LOC106172361 isoform X2 n=1 Tax=Lingula anatina TaxID=7574 RepID=A0A1S3JE82_LINAN|nr:uncharacterized protein LOC106172361 isoform X2 [Lingula anatina]|eukprot:XP_013408476.1 uncharacterized protein LOC106172361 isoform X2 [Lingula anatina]
MSLVMDSATRRKSKSDENEVQYQAVGKELEIVEKDRYIKTDPSENRKRRTIILSRTTEKGTWGFTLQTYGIHHKKKNELELMTYVDYVAFNGPAYYAGMRPGDVILSINGSSMEEADHDQLVNFVRSRCGKTMRMVVLFEDCCRKVELHMRYTRLKNVLADKMFELRSLQAQERRISKGMKPLKGKSLERDMSDISTPKSRKIWQFDEEYSSDTGEHLYEDTEHFKRMLHSPRVARGGSLQMAHLVIDEEGSAGAALEDSSNPKLSAGDSTFSPGQTTNKAHDCTEDEHSCGKTSHHNTSGCTIGYKTVKHKGLSEYNDCLEAQLPAVLATREDENKAPAQGSSSLDCHPSDKFSSDPGGDFDVEHNPVFQPPSTSLPSAGDDHEVYANESDEVTHL